MNDHEMYELASARSPLVAKSLSLIDVSFLNLDSTSMKNIREASSGDEENIRARILQIVNTVRCSFIHLNSPTRAFLSYVLVVFPWHTLTLECVFPADHRSGQAVAAILTLLLREGSREDA